MNFETKRRLEAFQKVFFTKLSYCLLDFHPLDLHTMQRDHKFLALFSEATLFTQMSTGSQRPWIHQ
jgi:hypothetical protein